MGNLVSLHKNDFDRIYAFLRFFGKKIILRTSEGYIFYKNDDKTCSLKDFTESIIDNIYKGSFEHLVIEIFEDIESKDFNDYFEKAISTCLLHHVTDPVAALIEAHRVTKTQEVLGFWSILSCTTKTARLQRSPTP
jgi:SAM-dependent methyltransferase